MDLSKLNGKTFDKVFDDVDVKNYPFIEKGNAIDETFTVKAVYLTKGVYGFQSVFILENPNGRISFMGRNLFDEIVSDKQMIDTIKNGKITLTVKSYYNEKYKKTCYKPYFEEIPF